jgi:hypothetical protein
MNLYRVTVRREDGKLSVQETEAGNLQIVLQSHDQSDVVKVERIDPLTGEVLGGFTASEWSGPNLP